MMALLLGQRSNFLLVWVMIGSFMMAKVMEFELICNSEAEYSIR